MVRFAPAVGFGLGAGSRGAQSSRSNSFAECSPLEGGTRDCSELHPKNWFLMSSITTGLTINRSRLPTLRLVCAVSLKMTESRCLSWVENF